MTRIGLIGCGRIARLVHLDALARVPAIDVVALADAAPERLAEAGARVPGARRFETAEALLAESDAEAVVIATPPATHADLAIAAFEAGRHVYLEKPVATSLAEARRVAEAHRRAGTEAAVGFNYRFHPLAEGARAARAQIGALVGVRTVFTSAARTLPAWKRRRATGGGILLDLGSHHADLVPYLTGERVAEVWADVHDAGDAEGAIASVHARLESGAPAQLFFASGATDEDRVELVGADGRLHYDRLRSAAVQVEAPAFAYGRGAHARRTARAATDGLRRTLAPPGDASFARAFAAFAAACEGDRPAALATLEDGLRSLAVVEAAEASAASGRSVAPEPVEASV